MNVFEATKKRLNMIFSEFEYIYVSFSGGKDSGVLLNMAIDYIKENNLPNRLGVFHIDYEAQYQATTKYVTDTFNNLPAFCDKYWVAIPLTVPCATSMNSFTWIPWNEAEKNIWVRNLPESCIHIDNHDFDFYQYGMDDYDFQKQFGDWIQRKKNKKTACLIGVRSDESLDRRIMISNRFNKRKYKEILWSTGGVSDTKMQYNFYPIYDWNTSDIWTYNSRFNKSYNKLYDLYYMAGMPVSKMRIASPFISQGLDSLKLFKVIEPNTWGKLVSRVNGVNFSGIYGGTTAMGWKSITKPQNHTWKSYLDFLLRSLPDNTRELYKKKFKVSEEFWQKRGGVLEESTISDIKNNKVGIAITNKSSYKTTKRTVVFKEYPDELTTDNFKDVPSYKRMVVCVLKNDHLCKYMGFAMTKNEQERRNNIIKKYKSLL